MSETTNGTIQANSPVKPSKLAAVGIAIGAVIYLISPVDLIPDLIPVLCHIDDVGVISIALKKLHDAFA